MPVPTTGKEVEHFLGVVNYLRDYIPLYAYIAAPLEPLHKLKSLQGHWGASQQAAVDKFKAVLAHPPVLSTPLWDKPFFVAVDASQAGVGAILYQQPDAICYVSFQAKALNPAQHNYPATKRELLAILFALSRFCDYLWGQHFVLFTDHKALTFLFTQCHSSYMLNNWADELLNFDFEIVHCPGVEMVLPDHLSHLYVGASAPTLSTTDSEVQVRQLAVQDSAPAPISWSTYAKECLGKVLPDPDKQNGLLEAVHASAHLGTEHMYCKLRTSAYYWPAMCADCHHTVQACPQCLRHTVRKTGFHPLNPVSASLPMDHVAIDLLSPGVTSDNGFNYVLLVVCLLSRFIFLHALHTKSAAEVVARLYLIFSDLGFPKVLQSDNGPEFINELLSGLTEVVGLDHCRITPYHPQGNGAAERYVQNTKHLLAKKLDGEFHNWDLHLPAIQMALNTHIVSRHGSTPFSLCHGRWWNEFSDYTNTELKPLTEEQLIDRNDKITNIVFPAINDCTSEYNQSMKKHFDGKKIIKEPFPEGAMVMIQESKCLGSMQAKYSGPYKVLRQTRGGAYELLNPLGKCHPTKVSSDLIKCIDGADNIDLTGSFEVAKILDHCGNPKDQEYLVH